MDMNSGAEMASLLAAAGGCWLLLAATGCCWLLLAAAGCLCLLLLCCWLLAAAGCCWLLLAVAGCCWLLLAVDQISRNQMFALKGALTNTISRNIQLGGLTASIRLASYVSVPCDTAGCFPHGLESPNQCNLRIMGLYSKPCIGVASFALCGSSLCYELC